MKTIKEIEMSRKNKFRRKGKSPSPKMTSLSKRSRTYGVLGIGRLGRALVAHLINMKKKIFIWNRTYKNCKQLIEALDSTARAYVEICHISSLVIQKSDFIFNCISDGQGSMEVITTSLSDEYASDKFMVGKGLIDMSGVGPEGQMQLYKLVTTKGGKYLEVRIQLRNDLIGGGHLFVAGGNADLFTDCKNVFKALDVQTVYFKKEIGYITTLNLSLQMMKHVYLLGICEGFALLERFAPLGFHNQLLPVLFKSPIRSDYMESKVHRIFKKNFQLLEQSLENFENDIAAGIKLSNKVDAPMFLSSVGNQILKHCIKLGFGDLDPSAVFMRSRH